MASISNDGDGKRRIQFVDGDGKRKAIRLGKVTARDAMTIKLKVEALLSAKLSGASGVDRETAMWLGKADSALVEKLDKAGLLPEEAKSLVAPKQPKKKSLLLSELTNKFIVDVGGEGRRKPGTVAVWRQVENNFLELMPKDLTITEVTKGHAKQFAEKVKQGRATLTAAKNISIVKQMFRFAVDWELLPYSPFDCVKVPTTTHEVVNVEVSREVISTILGVVDDEWRKIIALSRYGGLRCPSEVLTIEWHHIDFATGRMTVPTPKLEFHEGKETRQCPLFPELREVLEPLRQKNGYVVDKPAYRLAANTGVGWRNANLRSQFVKQIAKTNRKTGGDIKPWSRLFHSLRASRQTELERHFPLHVVCRWLGNSEKIAKRSYLITKEEDWAKAAQNTAQ